MKLLLVLLTYLLCTNALNLNLLSNFDVATEAAGSITAGVLGEDLNIGTTVSLDGVYATISSDLIIEGTLTIGSTGVVSSQPVLEIDAGVALTVDALVATSAIINIAEGGMLIVEVGTTIDSDSIINVADGAMVVFKDTVFIAEEASVDVSSGAEISFRDSISGSGIVIIAGRAAFNVSLSADYTAEIDLKVSGMMYIGAGIRTFSGTVSCAGDVLVEADAFVDFTGTTTISGSTTFMIEPMAQAEFSASISGDGAIIADGSLVFSGSANTECSASIEARTNATVQITGTGRKTFTGLVTAGEAGVSLDAGVNATFEGSITVDTITLSENSRFVATEQATITGVISLDTTAMMIFDKKAVISAGILGEGMIEFSGEGNFESSVNSLFIESDISISNKANLRFLYPKGDAQTTIEGDLMVSGESFLFIDADSALTVNGDCSFEADTTYDITIETAASVNILTVSGQAMLNGNVSIETDITFEADVEIPFIKYSGRVDASTFTQVNVISSSSKRDLQQDEDYEVEYQEDQAIIRGVSGSSSDITGGDDDDDDSSSTFLTITTLSIISLIL